MGFDHIKFYMLNSSRKVIIEVSSMLFQNMEIIIVTQLKEKKGFKRFY